jgi:hypothetical protein
MKNIRIEFKWALLFSLMGLLWMVLEKLTGLHDRYIDYHPYLTNLFAIPAIVVMVMALNDKKRNFYNQEMGYVQGFVSGLILSVVITPEYFSNAIQRSVEIGNFNSTAEAEANFNYPNYAIQGAIGALVMGILTTAVAMIFIRTKK